MEEAKVVNTCKRLFFNASFACASGWFVPWNTNKLYAIKTCVNVVLQLNLSFKNSIERQLHEIKKIIKDQGTCIFSFFLLSALSSSMTLNVITSFLGGKFQNTFVFSVKNIYMYIYVFWIKTRKIILVSGACSPPRTSWKWSFSWLYKEKNKIFFFIVESNAQFKWPHAMDQICAAQMHSND